MRWLRIWVSLAAMLSPLAANAQGLLIDRRDDARFRLPRPTPRPEETSYRIKSLEIDARLDGSVARVQTTQTFVNTGSRTMEVSFVFPLPHDGAIDRLTLMVDNREYEAKLLAADEARRIYDGYLRRNKDPALLEWLGGGLFQTSVFPVPPGAERAVTLRYSQLLRSDMGAVELLIPLSTARYTSAPIELVRIDATINAAAPIKNVYSPSHALRIDRPTDATARVSYRGEREVPANDFRLFFDVGRQAVGAMLLSYRPDENEEGYFLLLASPEPPRDDRPPAPKTVIFVVDRSGSMSGDKIIQAKAAARFVLNNLRPGDMFNVIAYDNEVESFRPEPQPFTEQARAEAIGFVEGVFAGGGTNIDGALSAALSQLNDSDRPNYILFLTDGLPTSGETNEASIVAAARRKNTARARVFSFGVGHDVNSRLLDRLSEASRGQSEFVRPNEDIEAYVSRLYRRLASPVLTDVTVHLDVEDWPIERGPMISRVYPRVADLFAGERLAVLGRYKASGAAKIVIRGKWAGEEKSYTFPGELVGRSADASRAFVGRLWAMRRVGEIVDEIDLHGKNDELVEELVRLATRHGILTPYTSFLADDQADTPLAAGGRAAADFALDGLSRATGAGGFELRRQKARLLSDEAIAAPALSLSPTRREALEQAGAPAATDAEVDAAEPLAIRRIAGKTFYRRQGRWIDSAIDDPSKSTPRAIERFSPVFYSLLDRYGQRIAPYLALEGRVLLTLDGEVLEIE